MNLPPDGTPSPAFLEQLDAAARLWGIEPEYWDIWGRKHIPAPEVKQALLRALGVACDTPDDLDQSLRMRRVTEWQHLLPPTLVVSENQQIVLPLRAAAGSLPGAVTLTLTLEGSQPTRLSIETTRLQRTKHENVGGIDMVEIELHCPKIPRGYHDVSTTLAGHTAHCRLIVTPDRAWFPDVLEHGGHLAGVAVSLYGMRSHRNWGCGDFTDLAYLLPWLKMDVQCAFVALNPLHAIDNRQPYNISPYLPNSAFFRNPIYIDIESVPEFRASDAARRIFAGERVQRNLKKWRDSEFVEYEPVWRAKKYFLKLAFREFLRGGDTERQQQFQAYAAGQGERLQRFATYCALWDHIHRRDPDLWIWPDWPAYWQDPESAQVAEFIRTHQRQITFYCYVQWVVDQQLAGVQEYAHELGLPVGLYHDLALAIDKCGADLWAYREYYVSGCRVGSPPDGFAPNGQDWAFPPPNTLRLREDGYQLFIDSIRANSRHGGALRMDHVMRLFRLYWIPDGWEAKDGAYVQDFYEDLLRILALESHRGRFFLVGEDLGTVSDLVRFSLDAFGVLGYKVFYFEKDGTRYRKPEEYARQALVSSTTHDLPTLAGFWINRDIEARKAAGLLPDEASYQRQLSERATDKQRMLDMLHESKLLPPWFPRSAADVPELTGELHSAIIGFLVRTPSMLLVLNQEDLTKEPDQQNLPASTWQYPNWRRKMKYTVEELRTARLPRDFAAMFRHRLSETGRAL
ncbi:MAG: 4-alpha-glucanotransferase [Acidobacteria bacterium]|nr:4-alpha-glucanotransferase [Acidobacteriota bacterium]